MNLLPSTRPVVLSLLVVAPLLACATTTDESEAAGESALTTIPAEELVVDRAVACPSGVTLRPGANSGFLAGGQSRSFELRLPPSSFSGPRPVLFAYHGTSEHGAGFIRRAKLDEFVSRGFIVIAPDAENNGVVWPVWDAMRPAGMTAAANPDLELFDKLLSCTGGTHSVDKNRIYATGHSAGGIFTNRLLRARSNVLAGGIVASGVFDLTGPEAPRDVLALVTWGGDNDSWSGSTPSGVHVPAFSFVEQASLASKYYAAQGRVSHARCRGSNLGHAWLPMNGWFADVLLAHPKGTPTSSFVLPRLPSGAPASCSIEAYVVPPLPDITCPTTSRDGCTEACQLFADCAVENRTVGPGLATELRKMGFTQTSCNGCVQRCQAGATNAGDARVLSCFERKQQGAVCTGGIEGASPLIGAVNECCRNARDSRVCVELCTAINANSAGKAFFPTCQQIAP